MASVCRQRDRSLQAYLETFGDCKVQVQTLIVNNDNDLLVSEDEERFSGLS